VSIRLIGGLAGLFLAVLQPVGGYTFERSYGGPADERAVGVVPMADGGFVVVGGQESAPGFGAVYFVRTDSRGEPLLTRVISETTATMVVNGLATDGTSTILVVGKKKTTRVDWDMFALQLDFLGNVGWTRTWGSSTADDVAQAACPTWDNGWVVWGWTLASGRSDFRVTRFSSGGSMVWDRVFGSSQPDFGYGIDRTADNGFIVVGSTFARDPRFSDLYLARLNDSGLVVWSRTFGESLWDEGRTVAVLPDSGFVIAGYSSSYSQGMNGYLVRTARTGQGMWFRTFGGQFSDRGYGLCFLDNLGCVVTGETYPSAHGAADLYMVCARPDGQLRGERIFGDSGYDCGTAVVRLADGGFALAGVTWVDSLQRLNMFLVRTDSWGVIGLSTEEQRSPALLLQAVPNPFRRQTTFIEVGSPKSKVRSRQSEVEIRVWTVDGRLVRVLAGGCPVWDGTDQNGQEVKPGVYYVQWCGARGACRSKLVKTR